MALGTIVPVHGKDVIPWLNSLNPDVAAALIKKSPYHYLVSKPTSIAFLTLYAVSSVTHFAQAAWFRTWFMLATAFFCGLIEILGWSGRLWSSIDLFASIPFQIQICCTIVAPTPLLAANFVIFGRLIERLGPQYSRLSPRWYTIVFCTCDVVSLVIQGIGGGMAAAANDLKRANRGANVMLGGIVFQLVVIIAFAILSTEYYIRFASNASLRGENNSFIGKLTKKLKLMTGAMFFVTLVLFIRAIYRTIELADGWTGRIIATQVYFNVLDGAMVILAIYTYNIFHPGILLNETSNRESDDNNQRRFSGEEPKHELKGIKSSQSSQS